MRRTLLLALLAMAPPAAASHFGTYVDTPFHDDIGRSSEPNFWESTRLLGETVVERVIDLNLDGRAEATQALYHVPPGHARDVAPGCTDDSGRQPSGLCWLHGWSNQSTGLTFGVAGMSGSDAPGRYSLTKSTQLRLFDVQRVQDAPGPAGRSNYVPLTPAATDLGLFAALGSLDPSIGTSFQGFGPAGVFAWYGFWTDKNGNGVIDHEGGLLENEFTWVGNCSKFGGGPGGADPHLCHREALSWSPYAPTEIPVWVWPGDHHGRCGPYQAAGLALLCGATPADVPGRRALCAVLVGADHAHLHLPGFECPRRFDDLDMDPFGDPMLGRQDSVRPDFALDDRTGDPDPKVRMWVADKGWPLWHYDGGLFTTTVDIAAVNPYPTASAAGYRLASAWSLDVDVHRALSPGLEPLLAGQVLPPVRAAWANAARTGVAASHTATAAAYSPTVDQISLAPERGKLLRTFVDAGLPREPNQPGDLYPGASFQAFPPEPGDPSHAAHFGWHNDMRGYREGPKPWMDLAAQRLLTFTFPVSVPGVGCVVCASGPGQLTTALSRPWLGADPDDRRRSLAPGGWVLAGWVGRWHDLPAVIDEDALAFPGLTPVPPYTLAPDGWVGSVVERTGAFRYRGYGTEACRIEGVMAQRPWAECHPDLDGRLADPQDATGPQGRREFAGRCPEEGIAAMLDPGPAGWRFPTFVVEDYGALASDRGLVVRDYTNQPWSISLGLACSAGQVITGAMVVFPFGAGGPVRSWALAEVRRELVVDEDAYEPYA